jgi:hypothetical protein
MKWLQKDHGEHGLTESHRLLGIVRIQCARLCSAGAEAAAVHGSAGR